MVWFDCYWVGAVTWLVALMLVIVLCCFMRAYFWCMVITLDLTLVFWVVWYCVLCWVGLCDGLVLLAFGGLIWFGFGVAFCDGCTAAGFCLGLVCLLLNVCCDCAGLIGLLAALLYWILVGYGWLLFWDCIWWVYSYCFDSVVIERLVWLPLLFVLVCDWFVYFIVFGLGFALP